MIGTCAQSMVWACMTNVYATRVIKASECGLVHGLLMHICSIARLVLCLTAIQQSTLYYNNMSSRSSSSPYNTNKNILQCWYATKSAHSTTVVSLIAIACGWKKKIYTTTYKLWKMAMDMIFCSNCKNNIRWPLWVDIILLRLHHWSLNRIFL